MIFYPNCKINIGLDILRKRDDGFHEISTLMWPVRGLNDILEIVPSHSNGVQFTSSGLTVDCDPSQNLCVKAYELLAKDYNMKGVRIHLHKIIPFGAGLGGGSADAVTTLKGLDRLFGLELGTERLREYASRLGSDTAFFVVQEPMLCSGRGEILRPATLPQLENKILVIVKPPLFVSTKDAYARVVPAVPEYPLEERLAGNINRWKGTVSNAFETSVFRRYTQISSVKEKLYDMGAVYASMSGSGSAVFGIFDNDVPDSEPENSCTEKDSLEPRLKEQFPDCFIYQEVIGQKG